MPAGCPTDFQPVIDGISEIQSRRAPGLCEVPRLFTILRKWLRREERPMITCSRRPIGLIYSYCFYEPAAPREHGQISRDIVY